MNDSVIQKDELYDIAGAAMSILNSLGHGFHEKLYENALAVEFSEQNIAFEQQKQFKVFYKSKDIGTYIPDFIVYGSVVVELKTVDKITDNEIGQVINYLKVTGLSKAIILNFKHAKLEWKRVIL